MIDEQNHPPRLGGVRVRNASDLVAVDAASGHPVGVLSTLDVASVYAGN
jgi:hypothetical protein